MNFLIGLAALAVVLGVLVFIHEAGHFVAAKMSGIHVHRFSLGLGSPIPWLTTKRGETEYSISWLPLGGYVKMATAEEEVTSSALEGGRPTDPVPPGKMFEAKPIWVRMIVILAGVTMNVLFAWLIFSGLAFFTGETVAPTTTVGQVITDSLPADAAALGTLQAGDRIVRVSGQAVKTWEELQGALMKGRANPIRLSIEGKPDVVIPIPVEAMEERIRLAQALVPYQAAVAGTLLPGKPAEKAGIELGDTIVSADSMPVAQWYDLVEYIQTHPGRPIAFGVVRGARHLTLTAIPDAETIDSAGTKRQVGKIGLGVEIAVDHRNFTLGQSIVVGVRQTLDASTQIVRGVRGMLSGKVSRRSVGGPILIGQMAGQSARLGLDVFLSFMAFISVNLAVLNLLPIPVLDGGQFMFLLGEAILRRPLSLRLRERLTVVGLVLIVLLMVFAFSNDIRRLFGG